MAAARRELVVGPRHTFRDLAAAIDDAFARRDRSHLWGFTLADGRRVGPPDPDGDPEEWELPLADAGRLRVVDTVPPGGEFRCVYDLGDRWVHRCTVARSVDPRPPSRRGRPDAAVRLAPHDDRPRAAARR